MLTLNQFAFKWQRLHHPSMDVSGDVAFFYELYSRLHTIISQEARFFYESEILRLVLYAENIIAIGLDGVYEYRYRSIGNVVCNQCDKWHLPVKSSSQIDNIIRQAVADATNSSLRRWVIESVLSGNFRWLSGMLTWFIRTDACLRRVCPDLRFRKTMFRKLTGNKWKARQMLLADLAFNWKDKRGYSLSAVIAEKLREIYQTKGNTEKSLLKEAADALGTIHSERLDTYTVIERKDDNTFALRHRDGRVFENVALNEELSVKNEKSDYLAAQFVTYLGKTYINGPAVWLDSEDIEIWNGERIWTDIINKEQEAAKQCCFTTAFSRRISLYDDLYTVPEDPEEAYDADWGIYWDEPNIFDFLELFGQLKPAETHGA